MSTSNDGGSAIKARLRADLLVAIRERRTDEARVIRALVAALDNAEAPPALPGPMTLSQRQFSDRSAEVERLLLNEAQVRAALLAEVDERERAAAELDRLQAPDRAELLRTEALLIRRYLD